MYLSNNRVLLLLNIFLSWAQYSGSEFLRPSTEGVVTTPLVKELVVSLEVQLVTDLVYYHLHMLNVIECDTQLHDMVRRREWIYYKVYNNVCTSTRNNVLTYRDTGCHARFLLGGTQFFKTVSDNRAPVFVYTCKWRWSKTWFIATISIFNRFFGWILWGGDWEEILCSHPLYETLTYVCFEKDHNNHGIISVLALPDLITLHKSVNVHVLYAYIH